MPRIALLITRYFLLALSMCLLTFAVQAQVYKFVDDKGIVNYTNVAPPKGHDFQVLRFPCYASDPKCRSVSWEKVALNTQSFSPEIQQASLDNGVDSALLRAIIHAESAYQVDAVSPKGAKGLMQLMPQTAKMLQVNDPFNPANNIDGGARYLSELLQQFDGDVTLAAAAYNAGPGAVTKYGGVPPYEETREYVRRVNILNKRYSAAGG
ncbi:MAG: lytic transglycosylase domain-containing protein [Xanthomonadales bacterium]|nr:lytic transglycosylase domain-containing protein [Xanthomonadales bacterium]